MKIEKKTTFQCNCSTFHWNTTLDESALIKIVEEEIRKIVDEQLTLLIRQQAIQYVDGSILSLETDCGIPTIEIDINPESLHQAFVQRLGASNGVL